MDFTFTEDQLLFRESVRDFLVNEITPERLRGLWESDSGHDADLYKQMAELGITGMLVPEAHGGLGMTALDFVQIAEECGYVALPNALITTALVAVPVILASGDEALQSEWLPKIASGDAVVAVGLDANLLVEDAHIADLVLLQQGQDVLALRAGEFECERNESVDPGRRLYAVTPKAGATVIASGEQATALVDCALNHGALSAAAQALGLSQRMLDMSVQYTAERKQFGAPIGSFQAVKHLLANVAVPREYSRTPVYRAAECLSTGRSRAPVAVSHAKLAACDVALQAAKNCIQAHGAMGYTWEVDLQIFMKRAWALANTWGDAPSHKQRLSEAVLSEPLFTDPAGSFA